MTALKICPQCQDLVQTERLTAHLAGHAMVAPTPTRSTVMLGSVLAWVFLAGCLVMFLAVVWKCVRWSAA